eukprot:scaffold17957_cov122-Isochrysis_galbana.AAC.2
MGLSIGALVYRRSSYIVCKRKLRVSIACVSDRERILPPLPLPALTAVLMLRNAMDIYRTHSSIQMRRTSGGLEGGPNPPLHPPPALAAS